MMNIDRHDSLRLERARARRWQIAAWIAFSATITLGACGVQEHLHPTKVVDPSNDFGPTTGGASGSGTPVATGSGGSSPTQVGSTAGMAAPAVGSGGASAPPAAGSGGAAVSAAGMPAAAGMSGGTAGMPAPSGATLDLGGTPVAKEDAIAFIHIGHSNMAGRAIGPTASRPYFFTEKDPHAWMYHTGKPPEQAYEPYTAGDNLAGTYGGPGTALVKQAVALAPSKYFISLGFGKESAYCTQFLPGALYYDTLIAAAKAIKDRVTFGAIVIMLGITERHGTQADITGYSDCINKLVTAIRTDVGRPDLPLLITDYEQNATGPLAATAAGFPQQIIPEIHKIPSVVSNSVLVPTDGLTMQDDHHFDFDGHKVWTGRVLQIMKDKGWFPWK